MFSAAEVAAGKFDTQYTQFFKDVKKNNLRVIFRTMHEMNGGRYPRSSNPTSFKKAWVHVREISRKE
jgi:beta-mannanase